MTSATALLGSWFAAGGTHATTCIQTPATLADSHANAAAVVVAQVDGCANRGVPIDGRCPDYLYHLNVLEVLKDSVPAQDFSGTYRGADPMGCGIPFVLGESYLLFLSASGSIDPDASGALKGKVERTRRLQESVRILRDYRDGRSDDLAGPWSFADSGLTCELRHEVAGRTISFGYAYSALFLTHNATPEYDDDGNVAHVTHVDTAFPPPWMAHNVDIVREGPELTAGTLFFTARFDPHAATVRDSATVQVGNRSWNLASHAMTFRSNGVDVGQPIVSELAWGNVAEEILAAMLEPRDVIVQKERAADGQPPPSGDDLLASIETRTTQIRSEAAKFSACVDGSVRRGVSSAP